MDRLGTPTAQLHARREVRNENRELRCVSREVVFPAMVRRRLDGAQEPHTNRSRSAGREKESTDEAQKLAGGAEVNANTRKPGKHCAKAEKNREKGNAG